MDKSMTPIAQWPIHRTRDGYYRLVNHEERLLTVGYKDKSVMDNNRPIVRLDYSAKVVMRTRYVDEFGALEAKYKKDFGAWPVS